MPATTYTLTLIGNGGLAAVNGSTTFTLQSGVAGATGATGPAGTTVHSALSNLAFPAGHTGFPGLAAANTYMAQNIFETGAAGASPVVFQQTGGGASRRLEIGHNGSSALLKSLEGPVVVQGSAGSSRQINFGGVTGVSFGGVWGPGSMGIGLNVDGVNIPYIGSQVGALGELRVGSISFGTGVYSNTKDGAIERASPAVLKLTDGSTGGGTLSSPFLTPAPLTASVNNYNPGVGMNIRHTTDGLGAVSITGFAITQQDGQIFSGYNVGVDAITLVHESASSTAANRFTNTSGGDIVLLPGQGYTAVYDTSSLRYRITKRA